MIVYIALWDHEVAVVNNYKEDECHTSILRFGHTNEYKILT